MAYLRGNGLIVPYYFCRGVADGLPGVVGPDGIGR